jgi:hypothetical protein
MKKPISVQFKFLKDLSFLTEPTEPRMDIVQTMQIPAQDQKKLNKRVKVREIPTFTFLFALACALVLCGCLFLLIILHQ